MKLENICEMDLIGVLIRGDMGEVNFNALVNKNLKDGLLIQAVNNIDKINVDKTKVENVSVKYTLNYESGEETIDNCCIIKIGDNTKNTFMITDSNGDESNVKRMYKRIKADEELTVRIEDLGYTLKGRLRNINSMGFSFEIKNNEVDNNIELMGKDIFATFKYESKLLVLCGKIIRERETDDEIRVYGCEIIKSDKDVAEYIEMVKNKAMV